MGREIKFRIKTNIDIFLEYLNTASVVYRDSVCITDMSTFRHTYGMLPTDIECVAINPNKTFTVLFENGEKNVFALYLMKPHFYPTDEVDICISELQKRNFENKDEQ